MSKYGSNQCWLCLCEVCTRFQCPKLNRRFRMDFCLSMLTRERCPVVKCDWFRHKEKQKVYRFLRRERKRDKLLERLDNIQRGIEELKKRGAD